MAAVINRRSLVLTFGPTHDRPWWWPHIHPLPQGCELRYVRISLGSKRAQELSAWDMLVVMGKVAQALYTHRRWANYVFTFECDVTSYAVALLQTLSFRRKPRHVILQFIMRERVPTVASRLKFLFLKFCFASVSRVVCSSRPECDYYRHAFSWDARRLAFVPFHTDPAFFAQAALQNSGYIIAAGRTFRDYATLLRAAPHIPAKIIIVAGKGTLAQTALPANVELRHDVPLARLSELIAASCAVVLPLEDRRISIGQSVLLQAMALGKPVVATRTAGTVDYVRDGENGLLVPPEDAAALSTALTRLIHDSDLCQRLARNATESIRKRHLPHHYVQGVAHVLAERQ